MQKRVLVRSIAWTFAFAICLVSVSPGVCAAQLVDSAGSSVGVFVEETPTTLPTPTTEVPPTTTPQATTTITNYIPTTTLVTEDSLANALPPAEPVQQASKGVVGAAKAVAKATRDFIRGMASGRPVADVLNDVLPPSVASVVVPAVRTASTFVFPIGLAGAVVAFLVLQQRVDASDPKLNAAPIAHDDDVVKFT